MRRTARYAPEWFAGEVERLLGRAGSRVRTDDLLITNQLLYQLSYTGVSAKTESEVNRDLPGAQPDFSVALCM
jgi:hypothetical protein